MHTARMSFFGPRLPVFGITLVLLVACSEATDTTDFDSGDRGVLNEDAGATRLDDAGLFDEADASTDAALSMDARITPPDAANGGLVSDATVGDLLDATIEARGSIVSVSVGRDHACFLREDSSAGCFGSNFFDGESTVPHGVRWKSISAGEAGTCGLTEDGLLMCWGRAVYGETLPSAGIVFSEFDFGAGWGCGIDLTGQLHCIGGQHTVDALTVPPSGEFVKVSVGNAGACAIRPDRSLLCWGFIGAAPEGSYLDVSVGHQIVCAIREDRSLVCFGHPHSVLSPPTGEFEEVATGQGYACARDSTNRVVCFGEEPPEVPHRLTSIDAHSRDNLCGTTEEGTVWCAGEWLGSLVPRAEFRSPILVSTNRDGLCWITDGQPMCSGRGVLALPAPVNRIVSTPRGNLCGQSEDLHWACTGGETVPDVAFQTLDFGWQHACGLELDGTLQCWGENRNGESTVPPRLRFTDVRAGTTCTFARTVDGQLIEWGLGAEYFEPFTVDNFDVHNTTCCGVNAGHLRCNASSDVPRFPSPDVDFAHVAVGYRYVCATRRNGRIACFGNVPPEVPDIDVAFDTILTHGSSGLAQTTNGIVYGWGFATSTVLTPF